MRAMWVTHFHFPKIQIQLVPMAYRMMLLCFPVLVINCLPYERENNVDIKVLNVGEELLQETLPLQMGYCLYLLQGLKESMWYEVKISYPASIPARFSLQLKRDESYIGSNKNRRLLNTEKLIFKSDHDLLSGLGEVHVLVTVEPDGIVAKPSVNEREYVVFNIGTLHNFCNGKRNLEDSPLYEHISFALYPACDELSLVSPPKVWWVVILAFCCMGVAFIIPCFLPPYLLPQNQSSQSRNLASSKSS